MAEMIPKYRVGVKPFKHGVSRHGSRLAKVAGIEPQPLSLSSPKLEKRQRRIKTDDIGRSVTDMMTRYKEVVLRIAAKYAMIS